MPLFYQITHRLRSCYRFFILTLFLGVATLPALAQTTWTGNANADWNTAGNWSAGVPTTTLDAIIPNVTPSPTIGANTSAVAKSVEVQSGATLTIASSATLSINDYKTVSTIPVSFYNEGTVQNGGQLLIGNTGSIDGSGIYNRAMFNNNAGGTIQIDRTNRIGLINKEGTFTNAATIRIGSLAALDQDGLQNDGTFNNNTGATIQIDRVDGDAVDSEGIFTNNGAIIIGANSEVDGAGIYNDGNFTNNEGGRIQIDRTTRRGLTNASTFTNSSTITIGASGSIGTTGLFNYATFNNNAGGFIQIDRTGFRGLSNNNGIFTNVGRILIGSLATVGGDGLTNDVAFYNNAGGSIQIDRTSENGIYNQGSFTNAASITIGALTTNSGILNNATINNNGCGAVITTQKRITNSNTFTNSGSIIEKASGNSSISSNTGLVQNLNGGDFTITTNSGKLITTAETFWTGCTSSDWASASNWSTGVVPTTADDVVIPGGIAHQPTIGASTPAVANSVGVESGAILTIASSATLTINGSKRFSVAMAAFYNEGDMQNSGHLLIGNLSSIGTNGLYNNGTFSNKTGATIQIDRTSLSGLYNYRDRTFTNAATIIIGGTASASVGNDGLHNAGTFNNNTGGNIQIDRASSYGINNDSFGTFTNTATITIGSIGGMGWSGIVNENNFENNAGGAIGIDRTSSNGLENDLGTFTNAATIIMGASAELGINGLRNMAQFNNNAGGTIQIDRASNASVFNTTGTFVNSATITIGSLASAGSNGIYNSNKFDNIAGGNIQIDRATSYGIYSSAGTFTNSATITIAASTVNSGIYNSSTINNGCGAIITTQKRITNFGTFTNSGTIVENSINDSGISSNSGLVRNLNGGAFTITTNTGVLTTTDGTAAPTITATPSLTVNQGESVTLTAADAISYHWSTGETTPTISVTAAGPYSVTGTIGSCSRVASVTLTVNVVTNVTVTNPTAVCAPATVDLTQGVASSSIPNATFSFYTDADGTQLVPNPAAVGGGTYYVKASSQEGGASSLKSITVVVNTSPTVSISPNNPAICSGQSLTLTASGANTYLWSTSATSSTINASSAGVVSVTGTSNGCSATATQTVTENAIPAPTLTTNVSPSSPGSATVIQNTPFVTLTAGNCAGTLFWTGPNNPTGPTVSVPASATGTVSYTVFCQQGSCSSSIVSFTITVIPSLVSGSFDGFVNGADCGTFRGWGWDRNKINTAISIDILDGPNVIGSLLAGDFRQDLLDAGKGNGKHSFRFTIPDRIKDGLPHHLSARVSGSNFILKDSPKAIICEGIPVPGGNKPPVAPAPTILIAPLAAQVGVPFSGTLVAFTDPEGQPLTYKLSGLPGGLSINETTRVISGTPSEAGTFVLTYQATDPGPLSNSVSFPLTVNPASTTTVTGNFEGYLDKVECGSIRGWVWDRNKPNTPVTVEFYSDNRVWGSVVANIYRDDLKSAGKGNGAHAYSFEVPLGLKTGSKWLLYGRVQGSTFVLKDSGKPLTCTAPGPNRLSAETGSELQVTVLGNPVLGQSIEVEIRGAEGQPVSVQLIDAMGREVGQRQIELAKPMERQTLSVANQPAGLLLLRVTSGMKSVTVKVLK